jgi:hypothetical protein
VTAAEPVGATPVYRPFALLAFATTLAVGTPVGGWMLAWLYWDAPAAPVAWVLLHAHLQIFGFFATLIPGVAPHLFDRFAGHPVPRRPVTPWVLGLLAAALALRISGTWAAAPAPVLAASLLQAAAFLLFASWVRRVLDPPELAFLRFHLTASTGWLALACLLETILRWRALELGLASPPLATLRAVHAMAIFGGVLGWVLGVLLRAGPMFVPGWSVPPRTARAIPWALALGVLVSLAGETGAWRGATGTALARLGELLALGTVVVVAVSGGVFRRARGVLPVVSRSAEESRIFRLAAASAVAAVAGFAVAAAGAALGASTHLIADAARHLLTVGFLTSVVVAMSFRLIPVLERVALPWPGLRRVAFWALLGGVALRTAQFGAAYGAPALVPLVPLSGVLVWVAVACVAANLARAITVPRPDATSSGAPGPDYS